MSRLILVDESKAKGYLLVAAVVLPCDARAVLDGVRSLHLPGQNGLHMTKERKDRQPVIARTIGQLGGVTAYVYDAGRDGPQQSRRARCLEALVKEHGGPQPTTLVLDQDDTLRDWDREQLYKLVRRYGCADTWSYEHAKVQGQHLLALPDVIAWCWAKGQYWRDHVRPVVQYKRI